MNDIPAHEARRLIEEAAQDLTGPARESYEGGDRKTMNEAVIEVQRGGDPRQVVQAFWGEDLP